MDNRDHKAMNADTQTRISALKLLKKYIQYVRDCEGTDYIESGRYNDLYPYDNDFSTSEWDFLAEISEQQRNG